MTSNMKIAMCILLGIEAVVSSVQAYKPVGFRQFFPESLTDFGQNPDYDAEEINGYSPKATWNHNRFEHQPAAGQKISHEGDHVHLDCQNRFLVTMTANKIMIKARIVTMNGCHLSDTSLLHQLLALNIDITELSELKLYKMRYTLNSMLFDYLDLKSLSIRYAHVADVNHFELFPSLANVKTLELENYILSPLPSYSKVTNMTLINVKLENTFGECSELIELNLTNWHLEDPSIGAMLENCNKLEVLRIYGPNVSIFGLEAIGRGMYSLKEVEVHGAKMLDFFTSAFEDAKQLRKLNLSGNGLEIIDLKRRQALEELDLSHNKLILKNMNLLDIITANKLRIANYEHNPHLDICNEIDSGVSLAQLSHDILQRLALSNTDTKSLCFQRLETLEYLDLKNCSISELKFAGLPISKASVLEVHLQGNKLEKIICDESDYNRMTYGADYKIKVLVDDMKVDCDCQHAWLARAHREGSVDVIGARCQNDSTLKDIGAHALECEKHNCENCTCRRAWSNGWTVADCRELGLLALPAIPGVHELRAGGNGIKKINKLDLSNNEISYLDEDVATALFMGGRQVWLSGNPIICDCDNRAMVSALQAHSTQVVDYQAVSCVGTGQPVSDVLVGALCASRRGRQWPALVGGGGALVALAALAGALYFRYGRVLEVFLYARGWCLCCVREDELDADRIYDAFVSFSHQDEVFVVEELVAGLESARDYRLCVHFRDWMAGEWIPEQIARSIEQSRRTIIVLSKSYLESTWGLLEFRMAHASTIEEGRARIIVIVLDEVVEDERLDAELRGYLRTNTYVRWADRWFWEKLQYAMPRGALRGRQGAAHEMLEVAPPLPGS